MIDEDALGSPANLLDSTLLHEHFCSVDFNKNVLIQWVYIVINDSIYIIFVKLY